MTSPAFSLVVPTAGRPSLQRLLDALAGGRGPLPEQVVLVDDRPSDAGGGLLVTVPDRLAGAVSVVRGRSRGPAAARNAGWRATSAPWVAFLDDDVVPERRWAAELVADLGTVGDDVAAVQGRIRVPGPSGRRPTDWERNVAGLETARWATADMVYRREALLAVHGFDERFPRAYREDTDLGLRVTALGWRIVRGRRAVEHPVGPAGPWVSLAKQAGNADDALMDALHAADWRERGGAPSGRRPWHLAAATAGLAALAAPSRGARAAAGLAWAGLTADLAWRRIAPGPRTPGEIVLMAVTSAAMPVAASYHYLRGCRRARRLAAEGRWGEPAAVLFDRDDTLVHDVPYNGDPDRVEPVAGAREALDRLRAAGLRIGVVSNQSGVARGLITRAQVTAVNERVDELLGPIDTFRWCPHGPGEGCECRKPAPGLILQAATALGVAPHRCVVVGDIGADVGAAAAAGGRGILVPTARTLPEEVGAAPEVVGDLAAAIDRILRRGPETPAVAPAPRTRGRRTPVEVAV